MSQILYTPKQVKAFLGNPNVVNASRKSVTYCPEFKIKALHQNQAGMPPRTIFEEAGFDLEALGKHGPSDYLKAWRSIAKQYGEEALLTEEKEDR